VKITERAKFAATVNNLASRQKLLPNAENRSKFAALVGAFGKQNPPKETPEVKNMTPMTLDDYRNQAHPVRLRNFRAKYAAAKSERPPKEELDAPEHIQQAIEQKARRFRLPVQLVTAIIKVESNFNPQAISPKGARGLMQLMPATAASLGVRNAFDIAQNISGGCRYLKDMLERYDGNLRLAVAAYNAGPGAVEKYGRVPPYRETQEYVKRVLAYC